jgi:hypothetical protein
MVCIIGGLYEHVDLQLHNSSIPKLLVVIHMVGAFQQTFLSFDVNQKVLHKKLSALPAALQLNLSPEYEDYWTCFLEGF